VERIVDTDPSGRIIHRVVDGERSLQMGYFPGEFAKLSGNRLEMDWRLMENKLGGISDSK
jgi:hypothetical protein